MTTPSRPWRLALGGLLALASAMGIGRFVYTPILPTMVASLHLTSVQAGLLASANLVGYLAGALAAAMPRLPGSRRTWFVSALAASALTTCLTGATPRLPVLLALRFGGGVASAFVLVFASSVILDRLSAAGRPQLSSVHFGGIGLGIALSAALVSCLTAFGAEWHVLWLGVGAVAALAVPAVLALVPPDAPVARDRIAATRLAVDRRLAALIGSYFLFGVGYNVTATFLVVIVRGSADLRPAEAAVWLSVGLAAAPSVALWNVLARRIGTVATFATALLVEAVGVAGSVLASGVAGAIVSAILLGGTFLAITALGLVIARSLAPAHPRRIVAVLTSAFGLGSIVAPLVAGMLADRTGDFTLPSLLAAGALAIAALLSLGIGRS